MFDETQSKIIQATMDLVIILKKNLYQLVSYLSLKLLKAGVRKRSQKL